MYIPDLKSIGNSQYALELNPTTSPIGLITDKSINQDTTILEKSLDGVKNKLNGSEKL